MRVTSRRFARIPIIFWRFCTAVAASGAKGGRLIMRMTDVCCPKNRQQRKIVQADIRCGIVLQAARPSCSGSPAWLCSRTRTGSDLRYRKARQWGEIFLWSERKT